MQRLGYAACTVLILGLWLPWVTVSIGLFGTAPQQLGTVDGREIGTDIFNFPVGWLVAGAGIAGAIGLAQGKRTLATTGGIVALLLTGYAVLAIPGKEVATANGQDVSSIVNGQVGYAWGVWIVTAAAVALLTSTVRMPTAQPT